MNKIQAVLGCSTLLTLVQWGCGGGDASKSGNCTGFLCKDAASDTGNAPGVSVTPAGGRATVTSTAAASGGVRIAAGGGIVISLASGGHPVFPTGGYSPIVPRSATGGSTGGSGPFPVGGSGSGGQAPVDSGGRVGFQTGGSLATGGLLRAPGGMSATGGFPTRASLLTGGAFAAGGAPVFPFGGFVATGGMIHFGSGGASSTAACTEGQISCSGVEARLCGPDAGHESTTCQWGCIANLGCAASLTTCGSVCTASTCDGGTCDCVDDVPATCTLRSCTGSEQCGTLGICTNGQCHRKPLGTPNELCTDTCVTAGDGICDDAVTSTACAPGSDCTDCGSRVATMVSGTVVNQTWTLSGSPYVLTGEVLVASLTIEPGVTVVGDSTYSLQVGGTLVANGTKAQPIVFTAGSSGTWGGLYINAAISVQMSHFVVKNAIASGVRIANTTVALKQCAIVNNRGNSAGGVDVTGTGQLTLDNCIVAENSSGPMPVSAGGIMVENGAKATLRNCILHDNTTELPAAARAFGAGGVCGGTLVLSNSVVVGNGATRLGSEGSGGIGLNSTCAGGSVTVANSILFNNVGFQAGSGVVISYSDVEGGADGIGNVSTNPLFADEAYHLVDGASPCVDSGNPDVAYDDGCLPPGLGQSRSDMGAYGGPLGCNW